MLKTRRLTLRPLHWGDLHAATAMDAEPNVLDWVGGREGGYGGEYPSPKTIYRPYRNRLVCRPHRLPWFGFWGAFDRRDGRFLGWFQFESYGHRIDQAVIGWRLKRDYWGRGLATEGASKLVDIGFKHWGIRRIVADAMAEHWASRRVMQKVGMRIVRHVQDERWGLTALYAISPHQLRFLRDQPQGRG